MNRNHVRIDLEICGWWNSWIPPQSAFHWVFWWLWPNWSWCDNVWHSLSWPGITPSRCHALRDGAMTSQLSEAKLNLDQVTDGISGLCSLQIEDQCSCRVPVSRPCRHDVPWCHVVSMKCCQQGFRLSLQIGRCDGETCSHVTQDLIGGREPKMLGIWASFGE